MNNELEQASEYLEEAIELGSAGRVQEMHEALQRAAVLLEQIEAEGKRDYAAEPSTPPNHQKQARAVAA